MFDFDYRVPVIFLNGLPIVLNILYYQKYENRDIKKYKEHRQILINESHGNIMKKKKTERKQSFFFIYLISHENTGPHRGNLMWKSTYEMHSEI